MLKTKVPDGAVAIPIKALKSGYSYGLSIVAGLLGDLRYGLALRIKFANMFYGRHAEHSFLPSAFDCGDPNQKGGQMGVY